MSERRVFFKRLAAVGASLWAGQAAAQHEHHQHAHQPAARFPSERPASGPVLVETPDLPKLPYRLVDGWKEFHLKAEVVETEFVPGRKVHAWGFNGSVPGPTIEVNQGDKVRVIFENHLPEMTAVHWHGLEVPMEMDGSVGVGQDPVPPGGRYVYEFELHQAGTFFYHSHFAMQEMMGMIGLLILHPKEPFEPLCQRDFGLILQEWALLPNNTVPNTLSMEFNWLTINGKAGPDTTPLIVQQGERVRIRLVNLGMDHHPIHLHGNQFVVTGTEGGRSPRSTWTPQNTVLVGVAQARDIEFEAKYLGDWMLHCHLPHHMMNQMVSMVGPLSHGAHGHGVPTGAGMPEGMGIIRQAHALSEELGPAAGRGLGFAADSERQISNLVAQAAHQHQHGAETYPQADPEKKKVPGYPQDMWMPEDEKYNWKPENYGLRKGWSGAMMGMMTLVRVVTPETFRKIQELRSQNPRRPGAPAHEHHHHGA
jgi:FtsP/CotA-like multicopper oxidase with cupredoxin domain